MDEHAVDVALDEFGRFDPPFRLAADQDIPHGDRDLDRARRPRPAEQGRDFPPKGAAAEGIVLQDDKLRPDFGDDGREPVAALPPIRIAGRVALRVDQAVERFVAGAQRRERMKRRAACPRFRNARAAARDMGGVAVGSGASGQRRCPREMADAEQMLDPEQDGGRRFSGHSRRAVRNRQGGY